MKEIVNRGGNDCESRRRILDAALLLFSKKSFSGTGLRELATEAHVNIAMISYFFESKKGLLKEILDHFFSGYLAIARETLSGDEPVEPRLRRFVESTLSYFENNRNALLITLAEIPHDDPDIIKHKTLWAQQMMAELEKHLCRPLAQQHGVHIQPQVLGPILTSILASRFLFAPILEQITTEDDVLPDPSTVDQITAVLLHGLLPRH